MASRPEPWPAPPPRPERPHPIRDRPPIGAREERIAALLYLSAACHMRRAEELCAKFDKGSMVVQMSLASSDDDLALIGRMQGRMGRAALDVLGVGADELEPAACPEGQVG